MKPYLIVVEDPGSDKLLNVALTLAETEQQAEANGKSFPVCRSRIFAFTTFMRSAMIFPMAGLMRLKARG